MLLLDFPVQAICTLSSIALISYKNVSTFESFFPSYIIDGDYLCYIKEDISANVVSKNIESLIAIPLEDDVFKLSNAGIVE